MDFDGKAHENIDAAERLLPDDSGGRDGLFNAAASRAYYAAYHAVAHDAQRRQRAFTSDKEYYRHDELPADAARWGILDADQAEDLGWLLQLRLKADYYEDHVEVDEASEAFEVARALVLRIVGAPT